MGLYLKYVGELCLYIGITAVWEGADIGDSEFYHMKKDGTLAIFEVKLFNPLSKVVYALIYSNKAGSYTRIYENMGKVLKKMNDKNNW